MTKQAGYQPRFRELFKKGVYYVRGDNPQWPIATICRRLAEEMGVTQWSMMWSGASIMGV